uniref:Uncharacterized protein n=1 Tax=Neogobius melanostomus TaxID=47308 RepID=A0A8C6TJP5_9GOBI
MEKTAFNRGFTAHSNVTHQRERRSPLWRPWTGTNGAVTRTVSAALLKDGPLYWPKSKCFDYLYQDAEQLLRNYPVQATICPYHDEESDYGEEDEEKAEKKELN